MRAAKVSKGLSKTKKIAGYISTFATIGLVVTQFIIKKKKK